MDTKKDLIINEHIENINHISNENVRTTDARDVRQAFMDIVYSELESDPDNNKANRIIEVADEYAESAQLGTNLAEVGTDCISRQAAIEAMCEVLKPMLITTIRAQIALEKLPPAQPEPCEDAVSRAEVLRMINCINDHHAITPYKSVGEVTEHLTRIASNLPPVTPKQCWIACSEKLPTEEEKSYWVCTSEGEQCVCRWTDNRYGFGHSGKWGWHYLDLPQYSKGVVAYMPLPKPYKMEGGAE